MIHFARIVFALVVALLSSSSVCGQTLTPLGHGVRTNAYIAAFAHDSISGNIYVGGYFENIGGLQTNGIAMWNGSQWLPLGSGVNGYVSSIVIINGMVYAGGSFTDAGGVAVKNVAMWDGSQWYPLGSNPVTYYTVMSLEEWNGELMLSAYLAAPFGPGTGIIKWDGSSWTSIATTAATNALVFLYTAEDSLYAYGRFNEINGDSVNHAAKILPGGGVVDLSAPASVTEIKTIAKYNNLLYAVTSQGTLMHHSLPTGWVNDNVTCGTKPSKLFVYADSLHLSMESPGGGTVDTLEIWNVYNGNKFHRIGYSTFPTQLYETIDCVLPVGDTLYLGGVLSRFNGKQMVSSVFYDGAAWNQFGGAAIAYGDAWNNADVSTLVYDSITGDIYAGGSFIFAGDSISYNVGRWDGSQWHPMGKGLNGSVNKLITYQDTLYAAGSFTLSGNDTVKRIAKWNGNSWLPVGSGSSGTIVDMIVMNNILYAGGTFTTFNGMSINKVVQYDGTSWDPVGSNNLDATVYGFADFNNALLAFSRYEFNFNWPDGSEIAQLTGNNWTLAFDFPGQLYSLHVFNNELYGTTTGFTTQWTDMVFRYYNGVWTDTGFENNGASGSRLLTMQNKLTLTAYNDRTYQHDGTSWSMLFQDIQVSDYVETSPTDFVIGGFFPYAFNGLTTEMYYNIGSISLTAPSASFTQDTSIVCDHDYVQFMGAYSSLPTTYEWQFPGGIPSASSAQIPIVKYNVPGNYDVFLKVTTPLGTDSITMSNAVTVLNCSLGLSDNKGLAAAVYPNPANDLVHVSCENTITQYTISNLSGKTVMHENNMTNSKDLTLDVSGLSAGVYVLSVVSEDMAVSRKLLITRP